MTNKQIANKFNDLAKIMELHDENKFKIRSYANAYIQLRKADNPLFEMTHDDITTIKGIGKAIADKIGELKNTGTIQTYERYRELTPPGVIKMLAIKGFGPKKISTIWKEMGIETLGELLYACNENRLIELKGFGAKTQEELRKNIEFFLKSEHKYRYADIEKTALEIEEILSQKLKGSISAVGDLHRKNNVVDQIAFLTTESIDINEFPELEIQKQDSEKIEASFQETYPITIYKSSKEDRELNLIKYNYSSELASLGKTDREISEALGMELILPEMKELGKSDFEFLIGLEGTVLEEKDIKGVVHSHTNYSDGIHSLEQMAVGTRQKGYEYLVISDHSQSAFYAGGLKIEDLERQWTEINELNKTFDDFRIFKSIESDILNDGSLDYDDAVLDQFDLVIASIHSNLKMEEEKATNRLIKAIEHPATTILGHPTGRLILSRRGYPIDHKKIIDACAANNVTIELNANPFRLDMDWSWIPYAMSQGVMVSINPDAHSIDGIDHIHFGVISARKGGLLKEFCLNAMNLENFTRFLQTESK